MCRPTRIGQQKRILIAAERGEGGGGGGGGVRAHNARATRRQLQECQANACVDATKQDEHAAGMRSDAPPQSKI